VARPSDTQSMRRILLALGVAVPVAVVASARRAHRERVRDTEAEVVAAAESLVADVERYLARQTGGR